MATHSIPLANERGIVVDLAGPKARIRVQKTSSCASCESKNSCHIMNDRNMIVEVANTLKAKAGDTVELSIPVRSLLRVSLIVYIIPIAALFAGALVGRTWGISFGGNADIFAIIGGLLAMGVSFFILKWFDRRQNRRPEYQPQLTRILSSEPLPLQSCDSK